MWSTTKLNAHTIRITATLPFDVANTVTALDSRRCMYRVRILCDKRRLSHKMPPFLWACRWSAGGVAGGGGGNAAAPGSRIEKGGKRNILNSNLYFMHSTNFKLLLQNIQKFNSNWNFSKFKSSVRMGHSDHTCRAPTKLATVGRQVQAVSEPTWRDEQYLSHKIMNLHSALVSPFTLNKHLTPVVHRITAVTQLSAVCCVYRHTDSQPASQGPLAANGTAAPLRSLVPVSNVRITWHWGAFVQLLLQWKSSITYSE